MALYRTLDSIPVLAKSGAILPLIDENEALANGVDAPKHMIIKIFGGQDGYFEMYEDDGETANYRDGKYAITCFSLKWDVDHKTVFDIKTSALYENIIPDSRSYTLEFAAVENTSKISATVDGNRVEIVKRYDEKTSSLIVEPGEYPTSANIIVSIDEGLSLIDNQILSNIFTLLNESQIEYEIKESIYRIIEQGRDCASALSELQTIPISVALLGAITEILTAQ
jgi:hypothetical protein